MFKRKSGNKPAAQTSTPTTTGEPQPTSAARRNEPEQVDQRGVPATSSRVGANQSSSTEQIAIDAYYRWLARGKPIGTDWEDWFEAERQVAAMA
jgi:hypothetical protein